MSNQDDLCDVIEVRTPDIDAEAIMRQIRTAIQERRVASGLETAEFDVLAKGVLVQPTLADLRRDLERLAETMRHGDIEMFLSDVRPSPVRGLIQRFRAIVHKAILFYVNRLAARQAMTDRQVLSTLRTAFHLIAAQQARIEALERASKAADETTG